MAPSWQEVAISQQKYRDKTIEKVHPPIQDFDFVVPRNVTSIPGKVLTNRECEITELPVEALAAQIRTGKLTALETVQAFMRRAALAQKLVNCITELVPERAITRAIELDAFFKHHGKVVGPLHGIPISVKEHVGMKGLIANAGFVSWADQVASDDATLLKYLLGAGCILYARTTEPQTLMQIETSTNLHGVTVNPFNTTLTCGGSSGGEGALIALRGSCLGVATDIGGSIRVPAANNGLFGFKPTALRLPSGGMFAAMKGAEHIVATPGPISTSLEGIKMFMKAVLDQKPHTVEPSLVPIPWQDSQILLRQVGGKPHIKIAVMWNDGVVRPHPPVVRAMEEIVSRLTKLSDFTIVDWTPYRHDHAWKILSALYFSDGGEDVLEAISSSGEPLLPLSQWIIEETCKKQALTVRETWTWQMKRNAYRIAYNELWNKTRTSAGQDNDIVDVILCPAGPGAAPPLGQSQYWNYTAVWNLLDYPSLIFPATTVDPTKDLPEAEYKPINDRDAFNHKLCKNKFYPYIDDDPSTYADAPVCLQLVGRRFEDEKVIKGFELIREALG